MIEKRFDLILDIKHPVHPNRITVVQRDNLTSMINVMVVDGSDPFLLGGYTVELAIKKPDNHLWVKEADEIVENEAKFVLDEQALAVSGMAEADIRVLEDEKVLTACPLEIYIRRSVINNSSIGSTDQYKALDVLVKKANELKPQLESAQAELTRVAETVMADATRTGQELLKSIEEAQTSLDDANKNLDQNLAEASRLTTELEQNIASWNELRDLKTELEALNKRVTDGIQNLETAVSNAQNAKKDAEAALETMRRENQELIENAAQKVTPQIDPDTGNWKVNGVDQGVHAEGPQGPVGPANQLTVGTVQHGLEAEVEITGDSPNQVINFTLPQGKGLNIKNILATPGELPEDAEVGDAYLVEDNIYIKTSSGWSDPLPFRGPPGPAGRDGKDGINGKDGETGPQGIPGEKGDPGADGHSPVVDINAAGNWTVDGEDKGIKAQGPPGPAGTNGNDGAPGKTPVKGTDYFTPDDIQAFKEEFFSAYVTGEIVDNPNKINNAKYMFDFVTAMNAQLQRL